MTSDNPNRIYPKPISESPKNSPHARQWGFSDTSFKINKNGHLELSGHRYALCEAALPKFNEFWQDLFNEPLMATNRNEPLVEANYPAGKEDPNLIKALTQVLGEPAVCLDRAVRLRHGHGHAADEIYAVRYGTLPRIPDLVVYPNSSDEVKTIIQICTEHRAVIIPYGGGTTVTKALEIPLQEERVVVSLDLSGLNRIEWIDEVDHLASVEAGVVGRQLEAVLNKHGYTLGHEPDSIEFSTVGGWVATRASGMKKNRYGNIEDVVVDLDMVGPQGVIKHDTARPRESMGIDARNFAFGSEGMLGVITRVTVRIHPLPERQAYASYVFPDFAQGYAFLREVQLAGHPPASVRLVDNQQFRFGQALKPAPNTRWQHLLSSATRFFIEKVKGFDLTKMAAATIVFEGKKTEVEFQEKQVATIAARHGGVAGGASNGAQGYKLTYGIAYIRDFCVEHWVYGDSFETSVSWSQALTMIERVKQKIQTTSEALGLKKAPFVTARVSNIYSSGVCVYFYLGVHYKEVKDPAKVYSALEHAAREEIIKYGGALSHHHGIGKLRAPYLPQVSSEAARAGRKQLKDALDPDNIFAVGNQGLS